MINFDRLLGDRKNRKSIQEDEELPTKKWTFKPSINPHSRRLLEKARSKSNPKADNELDKSSSKPKSSDIYNRRVKEKQSTELQNCNILAQNSQIEVNKCTFKPQINEGVMKAQKSTIAKSDKSFKKYFSVLNSKDKLSNVSPPKRSERTTPGKKIGSPTKKTLQG